jgi:aldehyde dehydrogenase (NAD+)
VTLELGGKAANIVLPDADLRKAAQAAVRACFANGGQTCVAPGRVLVQKDQLKDFASFVRETVETYKVGDPNEKTTVLGPAANRMQFTKVQGYIQKGIEDGAKLVAGGVGRPDGLERGYYTKPTVFQNVEPWMTIAKEEVFGPVLSILTYEDENDAIRIANESVYGLGGAVQSKDPARAFRVASRIRNGLVQLNGEPFDLFDLSIPFGGTKQSGNGREWGHFGFEEYLEVKAVMGYGSEQ